MRVNNDEDSAYQEKKDFIYKRLVKNRDTIEELAIAAHPLSESKQERYLKQLKKFMSGAFSYEFYDYHCVKRVYDANGDCKRIERTMDNY